MQEREIAIDQTPQMRQYQAQQRQKLIQARKKRRAERRRNQMIFLAVCAVVLVLLVIGLIKGVLWTFAALRAVEWPWEQQDTVTAQGQLAPELDKDSEAALREMLAIPASYDLTGYQYDAADARLVLVNTNLPLAADYPLPQQAVADEITAVTLAAEAAESYRAMASAALADGISLTLVAGYHDAAAQQAIFDQWQQNYIDEGYDEAEAYTLAEEVVAAPGASEHQTGYGADVLAANYTAQDIGYADTIAFAWLSRYAAEYGFVLRYPMDKQMITGRAFEPWHWRYVGIENAKAMAQTGLTLEEFIEADGML